MLRWLIVVFLALLLIGWFAPAMQRLGLGRLPGDFRFRVRGRTVFLPVTSTLVLSGLISVLQRWL